MTGPIQAPARVGNESTIGKDVNILHFGFLPFSPTPLPFLFLRRAPPILAKRTRRRQPRVKARRHRRDGNTRRQPQSARQLTGHRRVRIPTHRGHRSRGCVRGRGTARVQTRAGTKRVFAQVLLVRPGLCPDIERRNGDVLARDLGRADEADHGSLGAVRRCPVPVAKRQVGVLHTVAVGNGLRGPGRVEV